MNWDLTLAMHYVHVAITFMLAGAGATLSVFGHFVVKDNLTHGRVMMFLGAAFGVIFGVICAYLIVAHMISI